MGGSLTEIDGREGKCRPQFKSAPSGNDPLPQELEQ